MGFSVNETLVYKCHLTNKAAQWKVWFQQKWCFYTIPNLQECGYQTKSISIAKLSLIHLLFILCINDWDTSKKKKRNNIFVSLIIISEYEYNLPCACSVDSGFIWLTKLSFSLFLQFFLNNKWFKVFENLGIFLAYPLRCRTLSNILNNVYYYYNEAPIISNSFIHKLCAASLSKHLCLVFPSHQPTSFLHSTQIIGIENVLPHYLKALSSFRMKKIPSISSWL